MAIAAQLVRQTGWELSLDRTGSDGTSFSISFKPGKSGESGRTE